MFFTSAPTDREREIKSLKLELFLTCTTSSVLICIVSVPDLPLISDSEGVLSDCFFVFASFSSDLSVASISNSEESSNILLILTFTSYLLFLGLEKH